MVLYIKEQNILTYILIRTMLANINNFKRDTTEIQRTTRIAQTQMNYYLTYEERAPDYYELQVIIPPLH